jgi:hypothetical protein
MFTKSSKLLVDALHDSDSNENRQNCCSGSFFFDVRLLHVLFSSLDAVCDGGEQVCKHREEVEGVQLCWVRLARQIGHFGADGKRIKSEMSRNLKEELKN